MRSRSIRHKENSLNQKLGLIHWGEIKVNELGSRIRKAIALASDLHLKAALGLKSVPLKALGSQQKGL